MKSRWILVIALILFPILAYYPSLFYGFSQDDFIHLSAVQISSFNEFLNFFNPFYQFPDMFFFRPLSTQLYFFINYQLFGLNPLPFHLAGLLLHLLNISLVYKVTRLIWGRKIAAISAGLFGLSAVHFLSLYYISAFQQLLRTCFMLLSIIFFIYFQFTKQIKNLGLSLVFFITSLLSKETGIILPLLFIPIEALRNQPKPLSTLIYPILKASWPFYGITAVYLIIKLAGFQTLFNQGGYGLDFSLTQVFSNLKWYGLWLLGFPEIINTYPSIKIPSIIQFTKDYTYSLPLTISLAISLLITAFFTFRKILRLKKPLALSAALMVIPLLPVVFLKDHIYPHYLDLSLLGFLPVFVYINMAHQSKLKFLGVAAILGFILAQVYSLPISQTTHWATNRSEAAKTYHQILTSQLIGQSGTSAIEFIGTKQQVKELSVILAKNYAIKIWFPDKNYQVKYGILPK